MLKIAMLHYSCPPVVGGVEEVVRQQAQLFHRYGHSVKIIAGTGRQFSEEIHFEFNPLLSSRNEEILKALEGEATASEEIEEIAHTIFGYLKGTLSGYDVLIAHNVLTMHFNIPLTMALHLLAAEKSINVVSWNHDSPYFYEDHPVKIDAKKWSILKRYNPDISYVVISESREKDFRRLYGTDSALTFIPNGIDPIDFFSLDHSTFKLIMENNLFEAELILVQPSRLHPRKNIELSIEVIKALQDLGIHAKLLLTGAYDPHEGKAVDYYKMLEKLAQSLHVEKDIIVVAEYRFENGERLEADRIIMRDLYLISDLLFLPSKQEGFGIPLLEAGMIKLPIVCSDIEPFRLIGGDHVCYFSLDDSPAEIAESIMQFLGAMKTQVMYRSVIRNYAWDNIYHHTLKPYLENLQTTR
jgi:glycosyltransferase involved in cell wall biosynthesis